MDFLYETFLGKPVWMWGSFLTLVLLLLVIDLGFFHRKAREIRVGESIALSAFYIVIGLAFGLWVWQTLGFQAGSEYFAGLLVEKTLALDNIFVISLIFTNFSVPLAYQHRVLFWGILGVIVLRAIMIGLGATLVSQFSWVLYIFGVFLMVTGAKMLVIENKQPDIEKNPLLKLMRRFLRITPELHKQRFFVKLADREKGTARLWVTPLFVALILIEIVDIIFAVDSVPAIFAITLDPFVVYTSNIFAILGLRALYFALGAVIDRFKCLKPALAILLVLIGLKIFVADLLGVEKFPPILTLGVTLAILSAGVVASLLKTRSEATSKDPG